MSAILLLISKQPAVHILRGFGCTILLELVCPVLSDQYLLAAKSKVDILYHLV